MSKGFLTVAYNSATGNYLECAEALAYTLKLTQTGPYGLSVMVPRGYDVPEHLTGVFEHIIYFDPVMADVGSWNAHLKWQAYQVTPYDETILMDADTLIPIDLAHWWTHLEQYPMMFSTKAMTFKGAAVSESDNPYRIGFRDSNLPGIYTTLMYFKKDDDVAAFFALTGEITSAWSSYRTEFLRGQVDALPTDDVVMACALKDTGLNHTCMGDRLDWFSFVHMKSKIQRVDQAELIDERWTTVLNGWVDYRGSLVIGGYLQTRPVHYHDRRFLTPTILQTLREAVA